MRAYVINLAKNDDRLADMARQLDGFGIAFERYEAVYGATLPQEVVAKSFSRIRSYFAMLRRLAIGEIGCALSHLGVYRRIVERGEGVALVFEDDVALSQNFPEVLKQASEVIDVSKPQVILFSALVADGAKHPDGLQPLKSGYGADAYLITLPAAEAVLWANYPVIIPADQWRTWTRRKQIELFRMWPITASQNRRDHGTDIGLAYKRPNAVCRLLHKTLRVLGLAIDEVLFRLLGR